MILYNVTINIDDNVHHEWFQWMREHHIPNILLTGLFLDVKILKLLTEIENGGTTYSFQYFLNSMEDYDKYELDYAIALRAEHDSHYRGKYVSFQTLLEVID